MAIYAKPVRLQLLSLWPDEFGLQPRQSFTRQQAIDWFAHHYPKIKSATVHCHLVRLSTNALCRLHYGVKPHDDDVFFQLDGSNFRLYDPANDPPPIHEPPAGGPSGPEGGTEPADSAQFAYGSRFWEFPRKKSCSNRIRINALPRRRNHRH